MKSQEGYTKQDFSIFSPSELLVLYMMDRGAEIVLPELLHFLGEETFVRFVKIFSGRTIKVPEWKQFRENILSLQIWLDYNRMHRDLTIKETLMRLSSKYSIGTTEVSSILKSVASYVKGLSKGASSGG